MSEHAAHGALQLITGLASSAVTGAAGLAKTALVGRQDGYRAGIALSLLLSTEGKKFAVFLCMKLYEIVSARVCVMSEASSEALS